MPLLATLERFFLDEQRVAEGDQIVVAFSGGPDSTALLWAMARLAGAARFRILAAHLDHALDGGSADRARAAVALAASLGVPWVAERREVGAHQRSGESLEAAARRLRYAFLEEVRESTGARWVATAHHRDDQAETVLLRILFGSGIEGLAGIQPQRGRLVRPLLTLPRSALDAALAGRGLSPLADPTNADLRLPRNRLRHHLLPRLEAETRELPQRLAALATAARGARRTLTGRLEEHLLCRSTEAGVTVDRRRFEALSPELRRLALAALHRRAGAPYPAGRSAREELERQLARTSRSSRSGARLGCDCGAGWRWEAHRDRLALRRAHHPENPGPAFAYTFRIPGRLEIPELGLGIRITRRATTAWMFRGSPRRAGLALPLEPGDEVTVRNRRPGDRLHPLGAGGSRRLKEVLIDCGVPRAARDHLPLLLLGERIAWVPGVTIDEAFRLREESTAWVAEIDGPHSAVAALTGSDEGTDGERTS